MSIDPIRPFRSVSSLWACHKAVKKAPGPPLAAVDAALTVLSVDRHPIRPRLFIKTLSCHADTCRESANRVL